jgi:DNA-directed RNA polymerase subunit RPC12/RpoP
MAKGYKMRANFVVAIERLVWGLVWGSGAGVVLGICFALEPALKPYHTLAARILYVFMWILFVPSFLTVLIALSLISSAISAFLFGWDVSTGSQTTYRCPRCGRGLNLWRIRSSVPFQCPRCKAWLESFGKPIRTKTVKMVSVHHILSN